VSWEADECLEQQVIEGGEKRERRKREGKIIR
jgi:hypothetical protein